MLQKEVVDRMAAPPGNRIYGRLSIMLGCYMKIEPLFDVPATVFSPPPKVKSSIVRLHPLPDDVYAIADLIISRGGANSLAEIANLKKKAVIIPLGTSASRGDQIENAKVFANKIGWSILSGDIKLEDFVSTVKLAHKNSINKNFKIVNAVRPISELILKTVQ